MTLAPLASSARASTMPSAIGGGEQDNIGRREGSGVIGLEDGQVAEPLEMRIEIGHSHPGLGCRDQGLNLDVWMAEQQFHDATPP